MKVLVDTSIWSLVMRRSREQPNRETHELTQLILESRATLIGPIRQELLSGIADPGQFALLMTRLRAFPELPLTTRHFEFAAELHNQCRRKAVRGSHIDFLICAVAKTEKLPIFTADADFLSYSKVIGLMLYRLRAG